MLMLPILGKKLSKWTAENEGLAFRTLLSSDGSSSLVSLVLP